MNAKSTETKPFYSNVPVRPSSSFSSSMLYPSSSGSGSCAPACPASPNQVDGAVLAVDGAPSGSSTVISRTPGARARPEGGASKKAISALLLGLRRAPRLAMALLCRTTCCSSQAREGWRCASWAICARSVFLGR